MLAVSVAVFFAASWSPREIRLSPLGEEEAFSALFLFLVFLLSFAVFASRREIVELLREIAQMEKGEPKGRRVNFIFSTLFNVLLLLLLFVFISRGQQPPVPEVPESSYHVPNSSVSYTSNATMVFEQSPAEVSEHAKPSFLYAYTPLLSLVAVSIAIFSVFLEYRNSRARARAAVTAKEALRDTIIAESRKALVEMKSQADVRLVIVNLYNSFCRELSARGLRITENMTAREIMGISLVLVPSLPRDAVETLTYLFEKALYSDHPMVEGDRVAAEKALSKIVSSLGSGGEGAR